jgi:hypothetical protein
MRRSSLLLFLVLLVGACAGARQPPRFEPVGTYSFSTEANGQAIPGTLTIRRDEQGLRATLATGMLPELSISQVAVEGRRLQLRQDIGMGALAMELEFAQDYSFTGRWALGTTISGAVSGRRQSTPGR